MAIVANQVLKEVLQTFPAKYCYAFAYGSGVFAQTNQGPGKMTDLIFVVDDPLAWHTANLEVNSKHYSSMKLLGAQFIANMQERMACGVYYNPYCKINGLNVKYGVISTATLTDDLTNWRHLYIAGRLHKPVLDLLPPTHHTLVTNLKKNRKSALRTALLQRGRFMSKFDLYHTITELSYLGDTRMAFAENPAKVANIVTPLIPQFDRVYTPLLNEIPSLAFTSDGSIAQDVSPMARYKHLIALPIPIQISLVRSFFRDPRFCDIEQVLADLSYLPNISFYIRKVISEVVRGSSIRQTVQGVFSAGVLKSVAYALEKLQKRRTTPSTTSINEMPAPQLPPPIAIPERLQPQPTTSSQTSAKSETKKEPGSQSSPFSRDNTDNINDNLADKLSSFQLPDDDHSNSSSKDNPR